jgi:hypothetical protein
MKTRNISLLVAALFLANAAFAQQPEQLSSPDGNLRLSFALAQNGQPTYSLAYKNKVLQWVELWQQYRRGTPRLYKLRR